MKLKRVVAWGLALTMTLCLDIPGVNAASGGSGATSAGAVDQVALATGDGTTPGQLPGTNRTFFDENSDVRDWFNISGYVADGVQDRSEYYEEYVANGKKNTKNYIVVEEDGYLEKTTEEYITETEYEALSAADKENYRFMTAEAQFLGALDRGAKVIQVNAEELELGFHYLQDNGIHSSSISAVTDYGKGYAPQTNPVIMHKDDVKDTNGNSVNPDMNGTGVSDLSLYSHLTLFSTTGCVIRHAGIDLGGCDDVIIRNFRMEGMYEWDDHKVAANAPWEDFTTRKRYGWCNVSLNNSNNIWVDHCTFGFAFDGNLDMKNGSSVSVTWCQFGVQDLSTNGEENQTTTITTADGKDIEVLTTSWKESKGSELWKNILYMEECYRAYKMGTATERFEAYVKYRDQGATPTEILRYAAMHSKVHLCGSGETSFYTNVDEKISLGFNYYTNIIQRIPMIRQGNGHMYNCIVDNTEFTANSKALESKGVGIGYKYANSVNNPRDGASIGSDTCIFRDVNPSCGTESQGDDLSNVGDNWKDIFAPMINHSLIVNSKIEKTKAASGEDITAEGSSWDNNGENEFTKGWKWNDKSTIGNFKWSKWKNQDELAEFSNITNKLEGSTGKLSKYGAAYYSDFYEGSDALGYDYQCFGLDKVEEMLEAHGGAHKNIYGSDETALDYIQPYNKAVMEKIYKKKAIINLGGATTAGKENNTYYLKDGESVTLPTAEELKNEDEGYAFSGWKKGSYNAQGQLELSEFLAAPDEKVTINAGNAYEEEYYYAIWNIKTYEVTFDSMGGSEVKDVLTIEHYQMISAAGGFPTDPTKDGYIFAGWYRYNPTTQKYGTRVRPNTVLNTDICLYAKWDNAVTFVTNGGSEIAPIGVETGKKVSVADPTKPGFTFTGWYKDEACTEPFDITKETITGPTTLYAGWEGGVLIGDVNDDGLIDSNDALEILKRDVGIATDGFIAEAADVNGDDAIDSNDALEILKFDVGIITEFNTEQD